MTALKIGIVGCGHAARVHSARLAALDGVKIVGCADPELQAARDLVAALGVAVGPPDPIPTFTDHQQLIERAAPDVLAIFTPPLAHYRPAMDGLQAGCHLFIEKPLSTNAQEADDIVGLARGRDRIVGVGHQFRLSPSLIEARRLLGEGSIGRLRLVSAVMAEAWRAGHEGPENAWRLDPKVAGGGILADAGDHLLDALIWTTGQPVAEVVAFQDREAPGLDVVNAVSLRLVDGTPAALAISGVSPGPLFEITFFGESGTLRASESALHRAGAGPGLAFEPLPTPRAPGLSIDADFIEAIRSGGVPCCTAEQALETVKLQEAIARSAGSGQVFRLAPATPPG